MKISVSPMVINFMLTCFFSPQPEQELGSDYWNSEGGQETRKWLFENGLIGQDNRATERGEAWVKFICETPLPVMRWMRPERVT